MNKVSSFVSFDLTASACPNEAKIQAFKIYNITAVAGIREDG